MSEIKFNKDELSKIENIQKQYEKYTAILGGLELQAISLSDKKEAIKIKVQEIQKEEFEIAEELRKKYGDGILNPETGIFTPQK